jgi:aldose 1-epimerase
MDTEERVYPSGRQYEIRAGTLAATVTQAGATLRVLTDAGRDLVDGFAEDEPCSAGRGQVLMPWPNRVDGGRYRFAGEDRQLGLTEPAAGNAIHGLVRWTTWELGAHEDAELRLGYRLLAHPGYPHPLDVSVGYRLVPGEGLRVEQAVTNVGSSPAPVAFGAHPYLRVGAQLDECRVTLPGSVRLRTDDRGIPVGREDVAGTAYDLRAGRDLRGLSVDHAFTGLDRDADGRAWATLAGPDGTAVSLWADRSYGWLQAFSGDKLPGAARRRALAVEPMTAPPNALVSGEDLTVLDPGTTLRGSWGVVAGGPRQLGG